MLHVAFSGEGQLVTEVDFGAIPSRFEDQVRFPRQEHTVTAWVTIESEEDGYRFVSKEMPETIRVEIESSRAEGLVGFRARRSREERSALSCAGGPIVSFTLKMNQGMCLEMKKPEGLFIREWLCAIGYRNDVSRLFRRIRSWR